MNAPETRDSELSGTHTSPKHAVNSVRLLTSGPKVQAREFVVEVGQRIKWHSHSKITDWCFCLEGVVVYEAADTECETCREQSLQPGEHCVIEAGIVHRLRAGSTAPCRYLLVQAGDEYDFNEASEAWLPS
jgi:quercetin dioxygenase-like cupin family protein